MPGIASDRPAAIQVGPISSMGSEAITPAIGNLENAFQQGFITVDDIQRRFQQNRLANDAEKTQLQAGDFQRRLAPGAFANAQAGQALQANQIQAAGQILPGATELTLGGQQAALDAQRHEAAANSEDEANRLAELEFRETRNYEQLHGHAAPKTIAIEAPENAETFSTWFNREKGKEIEQAADTFEGMSQDDAEKQSEKRVNTYTSGFPLNSPQDNQARAAFANQEQQRLNDLQNRRDDYVAKVWKSQVDSPAIQKEYQDHLKELTIRKVKPGEPEYLAEIQRRNQLAQQNLAVTAAKIKAIPEAVVQRIKIEGEAPLKAAQAQEKAQGDVLMELHKSESLKRFEPQFEAFEKVDSIRNSGRTPTNADDIAVLYEFVKLLDPTSAVREGEAKLAQSTVPGVKAMYNKVLGLFTDHNKIMDPQARASMYQTMDTLRDGAIKTVAPEIKRISNIAIDRGVPLDQVFTGPYQTVLTKGGTAAGAKPSPSGTKRIVQDGVTFEWNGTQFIPVQ